VLLDWLHRTRLAASLAVAAIMTSATLMAITPQRIPVFAAQFLQGAGASVLAPAIAALTLAISRHEKLGEKFGHNVRYAAVGSAVAAMAIGAMARFSDAAGFWLAAACGIPALGAVWAIRVCDIEAAPTRTTHIAVLPRHARPRPLHPRLALVFDRAFLVFAGCMMLFQPELRV
jgi:MFS family permease